MKKAIRVIGFTAAAGLILWGCSAVDYFGEYSGESFLTRSSFVDDSWELMPDYADQYETGTSVSDYMDYSLVSSSGGPNGGASYRLEIKNLFANGDFEDSAIDSDNWYHYDGATVNDPATDSGEVSMITTGDTYEINDNTLYFGTTAKYRVGIIFNDTNDGSGNYNSAFNNMNTYIDGMSYVIGYTYRSASVLTSYFQDNWDGSDTDLTSGSYKALGGVDGSEESRGLSNENYFPPLDPSVASDPDLNVITADNSSAIDTFFFTSTTPQSGYIDNVKIVRDSNGDYDLRLRLKMYLNHRSDLDLIPGYYRFSVYVKAENSATNNVFEADRVELGLNGYDEENNMSYEGSQVYYKTSTLHNLYSQSGKDFQGDWSSDWVQLVFETAQTVQLPDISEDTVMELTISPSNPGTSDSGWNRLSAGSILISEPSLEYSDGPWD